METPSQSTSNEPPAESRPDAREQVRPKLRISNLTFYYGSYRALSDITVDIYEITALIGPSGCGKSTFLRVLNRMYQTVHNARIEGEVWLDGENALAMDVATLRRPVGMVFQKPNPFPKSIYENVAYGLRVNGLRGKTRMDEAVERSLKRAVLWDEVKDQIHRQPTTFQVGSSNGYASRGP